jgi:CheY-like chemotaxis protein
MDGTAEMDEKTKILVVDDDLFMREMFEEVLGEGYQVLTAEDGADAIMLVQAEHPALILLDVEMPGMNGYETCIKFKQDEALAAIPVVFVSARDQIEERLKGYEVGGNDYVVKPFNPQELKAKIAHLLGVVSERTQLKEMASYATTTAMTAMTSMSEMGALLESLKKFNASIDERALAAAVLSGLSLYGLDGVVQVRTPEKTLSLSGQGEASPLEISIIDHMVGMDRIVQFKDRLSIHYPHVALLVNNMPMEDPDRCGRLRDHLAMLVEGAEMRATGIVAENESRRRGVAIERMIERATAALNEIDSTQRHNRMGVRMAFSALTDEMDKALLRVALTKEQEEFLSAIVTSGIEEIISVQSAETDLQNKLTAIIEEMKAISR